MRLKGQAALITGSTRGLGEAMARMFAREGAKVAVSGRNAERGQAVAASIVADGGEALFVPCDVGVEDQVRRAVTSTAEAFGGLTVLVNNARPVSAPLIDLAEISTEDWEAVLRTGVTAAFWAAKHALPHMVAAGGGAVVNVSSEASLRGMAGLSAYSAAKSALNALTRSVAVEYGERGIRANTLMIGWLPTRQMAAGGASAVILETMSRLQATSRIGRPDDIAYAAVYLASPESEFVTGQELILDSGLSVKSIDMRKLGPRPQR